MLEGSFNKTPIVPVPESEKGLFGIQDLFSKL